MEFCLYNYSKDIKKCIYEYALTICTHIGIYIKCTTLLFETEFRLPTMHRSLTQIEKISFDHSILIN